MKIHRHAQSRQSGFTLVELMIAILIGLFLTGGLLTLTGAMKRTGTIQTGLDLLHDNQRLAFTIMTDVVQSAGFFPLTTINVGTQTVSGALPAIGTTWVAGQAILGGSAGGATTPNDTLNIRYNTGGGDGVLNCTGATSAVAATWINTFSLDGAGNLLCTMTTNGAAVPAVNIVIPSATTGLGGIKYMHFLYGVQSNTGSGYTSVDTYLPASSMTSAMWSNVYSVQAVLYFANPLYGQASQPQYITINRVIALMNRAGVT